MPAPSASTIVADTATGSHVLTVDGYSRTKIHGVGECVKSGNFNAGGYGWHVKYYPNGSNKESTEWVSLSVCLNHSAAVKDGAVVKAQCKLSLLDQAGKPLPPPHSMCSELRSFAAGKASAWCHHKFIRRKELEKSKHLHHDRFSVRCDVIVKAGVRTVAAAKVPAPPPSDLHRQLGRLLKSKAGADVTFQVGGEMFAAHRCVLAARSPVFMAELLGPMREKDSECVNIADMEARVFKAMLHFIYTDSLPKVDDGADVAAMAQHLLVATDRFSLERLRSICEDTLRVRVDGITAATTLVLAEQHGLRRLKEACIKFVASTPGNLKNVMASDGFEHLARSCPSILKELASHLAD